MAKLHGPLLSLEAKGRVGKLLVYYNKNHARGWSTQNDPKTVAQLKSRAVVRGIMGTIKICNGLDRVALRTMYSKQWHTKFTAWLTRNGLQNAQILHDEWSALPKAARDAWELIVP